MHDDYGNKENRNTSNTKCDSGESVLPIVFVAHLSVCVNCLISGVTAELYDSGACCCTLCFEQMGFSVWCSIVLAGRSSKEQNS